jgi:DNA-directed RNA polymerase subunit RPC12/RpoP
MPGQGRTLGIVLIGIAAVAAILVGAWLVSALSGDETTVSGALLGFLLAAAVFVLPIGGAGVYLLAKGQQETVQYANIAQQKKLLNMVLAQGKVSLSEVAIELDMPIDQVEDMVRDLVGKNLCSGAINWQDGLLYSKQASQLKADQKCPNCGGQVELVGKSVVKCPFCGSEVFLAR